jgi:DNA-binding NtrC family response regulator
MNETEVARAECPPPTRKHLVVCVDDDAAVRSALRRLLRAEPYEFFCTDDPEAALQVVRTRDVSLFIADFRMPVMSGTGLLQLVKSCSPKTVRVLLTGYPRATWVVQAQERELMQLVCGKPWDNGELKRTILKWLHAREQSEEE